MTQLSPSIQAVLELFQGRLADQRFADLDAGVLSTSASAVEAAATAVAEQEAQLTELRQILSDRQEALLLLAQRALAYARVYAENDSMLSEELAKITLSRPSKPRKVSSKPAGADAESSAAGSELPLADSEPSAAHEPALAESAALPTDGEAADPDTDASSVEAPSVEVQANRKGKRRSNGAHSEATR